MTKESHLLSLGTPYPPIADNYHHAEGVGVVTDKSGYELYVMGGYVRDANHYIQDIHVLKCSGQNFNVQCSWTYLTDKISPSRAVAIFPITVGLHLRCNNATTVDGIPVYEFDK